MSFYQHKIVWITGASSGIGEHLAYEFAKQGAHLILSARNLKELQRVKSKCEAAASSVAIELIDFDKIEQIPTIANKVIAIHGKIDVLVNNAGISQRSLAKDTAFEVDEMIMKINYLATIRLTKCVLPVFLKQESGQIITITSTVGKIGTAMRSAYAASKHALHGFFDSLRTEVPDGIDIMLVCPGFIRTNISINALTGDGSAQGTMDAATDKGMDPAVLAAKIVESASLGKAEIYVGGFKEKLAIYLSRYTPGILRKILKNAKVT
ncbi:MAG: SDR family oxidoreductase [Saprospiraceae bacterium]|nr:SDR family oxidoreductase [Saprospiraceae bacterium]